MKCDSCFIYTLNDRDLVLRASKNLHSGLVDRLTIRFGQGITGWVAVQHRQPHAHSKRDVQLISTIGFLVGAEIELARMEEEIWKLSREVRTLKSTQAPK
jgi:uroporphyrinogen-III synthase